MSFGLPFFYGNLLKGTLLSPLFSPQKKILVNECNLIHFSEVLLPIQCGYLGDFLVCHELVLLSQFVKKSIVRQVGIFRTVVVRYLFKMSRLKYDQPGNYSEKSLAHRSDSYTRKLITVPRSILYSSPTNLLFTLYQTLESLLQLLGKEEPLLITFLPFDSRLSLPRLVRTACCSMQWKLLFSQDKYRFTPYSGGGNRSQNYKEKLKQQSRKISKGSSHSIAAPVKHNHLRRYLFILSMNDRSKVHPPLPTLLKQLLY